MNATSTTTIGTGPAAAALRASPAPEPRAAYNSRAVLEEVFLGHRWIDFDWHGWRGRARQALADITMVITP